MLDCHFATGFNPEKPGLLYDGMNMFGSSDMLGDNVWLNCKLEIIYIFISIIIWNIILIEIISWI